MIETVDLTKKYGDFFALESLTLKLEQGDLFGFIGPNGAGKTTTIRLLSTLLSPSWGEASVCGYSIYTHPREIRRAIGYMPDIFGVYDDIRDPHRRTALQSYVDGYYKCYDTNGAC